MSHQKTSRLFGKCPSCGTNFSDYANLIKAYVELQKFKPIRCKDRMPTKKDYPILIYVTTVERWFLENHEVKLRGEFWWMPMPPKPE